MNKKSKQQPKKSKQPSAKAIKNAKARARKKGQKEAMRRFALEFGGLSVDTPWGGAGVGPIGLTTDSFASIMQGRAARQAPTVGLAEYTEDIQVVLPELVSVRGPKGERLTLCKGTEFLSSISNKVGGAAPGDILATLFINPSVFTQTRLNEFAKLFQRFRFRRLNFWYKPIANTTQSGQLIGYGDYDPDNVNTLDSPDNLSIAAAHIGQATGKLWETIRFPFGVLDDFTTLFVDTNAVEKRLSFQGIYYLFAASEIASTISALGNLYIDYEVEFSIPLLQPLTTQLSLAVIDNGASPSETNPFGTDPAESTAVAYLPPASLSYSTTDESADLYFVSQTGGCKLTNNAMSNGDVWLYMVQQAGTLTSTPTAVGSDVFSAPQISFTNALVSQLNALNSLNPGVQQVTNASGSSTGLSANLDSTAVYIVRAVNNLAVIMDVVVNLAPTGSINWTVNGARIFVMRLYRGAATPSSLAIQGVGTLDHLRKQERAKASVRRSKEEEQKEIALKSASVSGQTLGGQATEQLLIRLLDVLGQQREPEVVVSSGRQPVWVPDYCSDRESLPQTSHGLFKRGEKGFST